MDSGNNGSLQSSSGGDEEYDSRAAVAFMSTHSTPPPPLFDPFPNYLLSPLINTNIPCPIESNLSPNTHHTMLPNNLDDSRRQSVPQNPKKRSRASRRAPTTVLPTDTTNFRAMVQEFTGIPAPPFHNNSNLPFAKSRRLDQFGTRFASFFDGVTVAPPYLLRPFPQKHLTPQPFLAPDITTSAATNNNNSLLGSISSVNSSTTAIENFSSNLFNTQTPLVNSLLQNNPTFPLPNFLVNSSKPDHHEGSSFGNIPSNGLFGFSRENDNITLTGLPNLISSDGVAECQDQNDDSSKKPDDISKQAREIL